MNRAKQLALYLLRVTRSSCSPSRRRSFSIQDCREGYVQWRRLTSAWSWRPAAAAGRSLCASR